MEPAFVEYAHDVAQRQGALAATLLAEGVTLITGGTDNHLIVIDTVASFGLDGRAAEAALDAVGITTKQAGHPRRSAAALTSERIAPRHSGVHNARDE